MEVGAQPSHLEGEPVLEDSAREGGMILPDEDDGLLDETFRYDEFVSGILE